MASNSAVSEPWAAEGNPARQLVGARPWQATYIRKAVVVDGCCALGTGALAFWVRLYHLGHLDFYLTCTLLLPLAWLGIVAMIDGYAPRVIGVGSDEFRRILNAGLILTASVAIVSYAAKADVARGYVVVALPSLTVINLVARYVLRKRLHKVRQLGDCMQRVVVVGYPDVVAEITMQLRREAYHGLSVVAACVAGGGQETEINGIPAVHGLDMVPDVVQRFGADTVAVTSCPEMSGVRLRELAWALEKTATSLCVAPALLEVAGQRTTIRPAAGLPLMYMEHPEFTGIPRLLKAAFDRTLAFGALLILSPLMTVIALAIKLNDGGPALFSQVRVGAAGQTFKIYKFRTMVCDAEKQKALLAAQNETGGVLFKIRADPADHRGRFLAAPVVTRRAAPAVQRARRRDVAGWPAAGPAGRGRPVRRACPPQARGPARHHRSVAGQRPVRPALGRGRPAGPALRGELVVHARPADPVEDLVGRRQRPRGLLTDRANQARGRTGPAGHMPG